LLVPNPHFLAWSDNCPTVLIKHDLSPVIQPDLLTPKLRLWHKIVGTERLARRATHIIAISENTARDLIDLWGIPAEKITVIYPGVTPIPPTTARRPITRPYILTLATKEPRKNQAAILQAFAEVAAHFPELHLVIAGGRGWGGRAQARLIASHPFKERIVQKPYVTEAERAALYRHAAMFVFPSWYEGFGFPPLEAMSAGVPVITSMTSATSEVCGDAALLVDPQRSVDLAAAMTALLTDDTIRQRLVDQGQQHWQKFLWERAATQTKAVLQQVARPSR
ncbi:MAG: glycosyltransferase family 1 protein, partial [Patescibacteria group bacterium]